MMLKKNKSLFSANHQPSILVVGDLMIDHYILGKASRLSPEAPVPVVNLKSESITLGGAANVVKNLRSLGANVSVCGVTGNDHAATQLNGLLIAEGVNTDNVVSIVGRTTTTKTRIIVDGHQLARVDKECVHNLDDKDEEAFLAMLLPSINNCDIVVISDYNKGLLSPTLTRSIILAANQANKKVVVDPKGTNFVKYKGAFIVKPNKLELALAAKIDNLDIPGNLKIAAEIILEQTEAQYLVVTLSEDGIMVFDNEGQKKLPIKATEVFDVTGAGDTVLATMTFFLALGADLEEACELANHAAAIVIKQVGSSSTTLEEILMSVQLEQS
jgi:rfaE bifunctional protein kinase chain/domain